MFCRVLFRIVVVIGGFWASITLMPPLLTCGYVIVVMLMCATSFATLASHLTTDIVDPDIIDIVEGVNPEAIHALPTLTFHAHDPSISPLTTVSLSHTLSLLPTINISPLNMGQIWS